MLTFIHLMILFFSINEKVSSTEIINKMNTSVHKYHSLSYSFTMEERWFDITKYSESNIKVMYQPYKVYMKFIVSSTPAKEILYNPVLYKDNLIINIGKLFPNIKLSPYSSKIRNQQHYTIMHVGFHKINSVLQSMKEKLGKDFDKYCKIEDNLVIHNTNVYKLTLEDPTFGYEKYVAKKGETSTSIAMKNNICEYLILEKNGFKNFTQVEEGMTIWIPKAYCRKCILYIDKQTFLPIHQEIYDDKGLLEKYAYHNIDYGKTYSDADFKKETPGFGF